MQWDDPLVQRALAAYFRTGGTEQPSQSSGVEKHGGKKYVVLRNARGALAIYRVRNDGIPVVGFTWYSVTDQVDWDTALREPNNRVNPLGLFDLDRKIRPVGEAYKKIVKEWGEILRRT